MSHLQYKENLEMRTRYADEPQKFMESELDLDEEVKKLMAIAGSPELYPIFVQTNTVETLLTLLTHQNTDIVADVIGVFEDLTDADVIEDSVRESCLSPCCSAVQDNNVKTYHASPFCTQLMPAKLQCMAASVSL